MPSSATITFRKLYQEDFALSSSLTPISETVMGVGTVALSPFLTAASDAAATTAGLAAGGVYYNSTTQHFAAIAGGGGGGSVPVSDATAIFYKASDNTALVRFSATAVSTATTRVITVQNTNLTMAGQDVINSWSARQFSDTNAEWAFTNGGFTSGGVRFGLQIASDGSALNLRRYDTSGAFQDAPISVARATGIVTTLGNVVTYAGSTQAAILTTSTTTAGADILGVTATGPLYPLIVRDSGNSPGITLFRSSNSKTAGWSAGATSAFSVQNSADVFRFIVLQNGHTQVGTTADQGYLFYVGLGDIGVGGNVMPGATVTYNLGSGLYNWHQGYIQQLFSDLITPTSTLVINGFVHATVTSAGTSYGLRISDVNNSPGINLYTAGGATRQASWSAGSTSAFSVQSNADVFRFVVLQNGHTQIGATADQGYLFYVNGTAKFNENVTIHSISTALVIDTSGVGNVAISAQAASVTGAALLLSNFAAGASQIMLFGTTASGSTYSGFNFGTGNPNGVVAANVGSFYLNIAGGAGTTLYIKESGGVSSAGWVGK